MSSGSLKNVINKMSLQILYLIYIYKRDLTSNNLQWLICHETQLNQKQLFDFKYSYLILIISTQLYNFKYSYLIQIIWLQLYNFRGSYLIQIIWMQLCNFMSKTNNLYVLLFAFVAMLLKFQ